MAAKHSIQVNFQNARSQAKTLSECAEEISKLEKEMGTVITDLRSGWQGDAANTYLGKCEQMKDKLGKSASEISRLSAAVSKTAKAYYDAEMRALEIAKTRSSGGGGSGASGSGSGGGGFR